MTGRRIRVESQEAFVLHAYPFRETSLIAEVFSREHGRLAVVARGASRPGSPLRGTLLAFQPLELCWFGRAEMRTLAKAEWLGGQPLLAGRALLYGYYLNELLLKLLPREDPHPALFDAYRCTLSDLASSVPSEAALRRFEMTLLKALGYGITLDVEADTGNPVAPDRTYAFVIERGILPAAGGEGMPLSGRALLSMACGDFTEPDTLQQSKALMRRVLGHYLSGQPLNTRRVFQELREL